MSEGYPLYYDGTNERGLSMAGLNFPGNARYHAEAAGRTNLTPFEFIPWVLGSFESVDEVEDALRDVNLVDISFSDAFPLSPLHWIIADARRSITVESVAEGLRVYHNPFGVLTNNPTFDIQSFGLNDYMHLSARPPENRFSEDLSFDTYSRGMGAIGLPGDLSSASRFVRAVFTKMNSVAGTTESESISQFFQILGSVAQQRGCVEVGEGSYEITIYSSCCNTRSGVFFYTSYEITIYSSCCNTRTGVFFYTSYENSQITAVDLHREDLDSAEVVHYPLLQGQRIHEQN